MQICSFPLCKSSVECGENDKNRSRINYDHGHLHLPRAPPYLILHSNKMADEADQYANDALYFLSNAN